MIKRTITAQFIEWKDASHRMPLLIRGARQVGKSFLCEQFGKSYFEHYVTVNFEFQPNLKSCFDDLDPQQIIQKLNLILKENILPGKTLLFLDEIQECPQAILALRYFKEKMPDLHVIGAGSLLDFALEEESFRMPVGRIQFLQLYPVSFREFLEALGEESIISFLENIQISEVINSAIHQKLLNLVRDYFFIGGMPAVVEEYVKTKNFNNCEELQRGILETYRGDFAKYAKRVHTENLRKVFNKIPILVGKRLKYSTIDQEVRSRDLKKAFSLLGLAGIIRPIYATSAAGVPLGAQINDKKIKPLFLDIGLLQNESGLQANIISEQNFMQINHGALAEQFVGQELLAYSNPSQKGALFFWVRDKPTSSAEIDYLFVQKGRIYPIEVKAGAIGRLKSLQSFMEIRKADYGLKISSEPLSFKKRVFSIPFYLIDQIPRILDKVAST